MWSHTWSSPLQAPMGRLKTVSVQFFLFFYCVILMWSHTWSCSPLRAPKGSLKVGGGCRYPSRGITTKPRNACFAIMYDDCLTGTFTRGQGKAFEVPEGLKSVLRCLREVRGCEGFDRGILGVFSPQYPSMTFFSRDGGFAGFSNQIVFKLQFFWQIGKP